MIILYILGLIYIYVCVCVCMSECERLSCVTMLLVINAMSVYFNNVSHGWLTIFKFKYQIGISCQV